MVLGSVVAGSMACSAFAAQAPEPAGRPEAAALAGLFMRSCFLHPGDATGLRAALVAPDAVPMRADQAAGLLPRPGMAFRIAHAPGHLMVLSFDDGWCGAGGIQVASKALTLALSQSMARQGTDMTLMGASADGREQRYLLLPPGRPALVLLVLLQPAGALMQASLFAAPMPDAAPEAKPGSGSARGP